MCIKVSDILDVGSDEEIKREIDFMIKDYHAYSMIESHSVQIIR